MCLALPLDVRSDVVMTRLTLSWLRRDTFETVAVVA